MNKPKVNEREYARLVSEKMKEHAEYKTGMSVEPTPENTDKPAGLHINGDNDARGIAAWAQAKIDEEYELVVAR